MLNSIVKRAARHLGIDIRRYRPANSAWPQLISMLASHKVNLVFDIGANTGQFSQTLREHGFHGRIVSFEPLAAAHELLLSSSKKDPFWDVAPRAALGSEEGQIEIHVACNSVSSSALNMLQTHSEVAPGSHYVGIERVPLRRFESIAQSYFGPESVPFLKIDTQGYEESVLTGAGRLLHRVVGVQLELSLVPLYEGQCLFPEMIDQLKVRGFELWAIWQSFVNERNGRVLQVDATFFRNEAPGRS
jgi:FkbM family methyltransferase